MPLKLYFYCKNNNNAPVLLNNDSQLVSLFNTDIYIVYNYENLTLKITLKSLTTLKNT